MVISRTARLGTLRVDDQPEVGGYAMGAYSQLSLPLNLFIGGVSDLKDVSRDSGVTHSFVGCVQKMIVNGRRLMLLEEALSGVNVADCEGIAGQQQHTTSPPMSATSSKSHHHSSRKRKDRCKNSTTQRWTKCRPTSDTTTDVPTTEAADAAGDEMYVKAVLHET